MGNAIGTKWHPGPETVIPAKQGVSKPQLRGTKGLSVIPAKAGIQGSWRGPYAAFPHSTPPGFPLSRE